ncbi:MAG: DUF2059 domain-containing protein [Rhodospirillales bacterium]|nr:DUF2059 domain-containing protein [Rhodospirillales bacterium]
MRRITTVLAASLLAIGVAQAQTNPAPAPAPAPAVTEAAPENLAEATKLTHMIGVDNQSKQLVAIMRGQMIQLVMRSGNKPPAEAAKIVDDLLMPDFTAKEDQLTHDIINVWASNFTLDDLKGLVAFYATPLGQKLIHTLPAVTQQGMQAGQSWGQTIYKAAIEKHKDELIARGLKF